MLHVSRNATARVEALSAVAPVQRGDTAPYSLSAPAAHLVQVEHLHGLVAHRDRVDSPPQRPGEAQAQLARYLADERLARQFPGVRFTGLIVVFHGWELVFCDAMPA